jgi:hypothetical protein
LNWAKATEPNRVPPERPMSKRQLIRAIFIGLGAIVLIV